MINNLKVNIIYLFWKVIFLYFEVTIYHRFKIIDLSLTTEYDFKNDPNKCPTAAKKMKYLIKPSKRIILYLLLHALFPFPLAFIIDSCIILVIFYLIFEGSIFVLLKKSSSTL